MPRPAEGTSEPELQFRFLFIYEAEIATTHILESIFQRLSNGTFKFEKVALHKLRISDIRPGTSLFFIRCASPLMGNWSHYLNRAGIGYIYFLDDNFWELRPDTALGAYYQSDVVKNTLNAVLEHASSIVTNSAALSEDVSRRGGKTTTIPGFFDFEKLPKVSLKKKSGSRIVVGFAASQGREIDLEPISKILKTIYRRHSDVAFEFIGAKPAFFKVNDRVSYFPPIPDYSSFIEFIHSRNWSIGLAPLGLDKSNLYKTNNKYREYGALRIPGVYSHSTPYIGSVTSGVTGYLAGDPESWGRALFELISSPLRRQEIGANAFEDVKTRFSVDAVLPIWKELLWDSSLQTSSAQLRKLRVMSLLLKISTRWSAIRNLMLQFKSASFALGPLGAVRKSAKILYSRLKMLTIRFWWRVLATPPVQIPREVLQTYKLGGAKLLREKISARLQK